MTKAIIFDLNFSVEMVTAAVTSRHGNVHEMAIVISIIKRTVTDLMAGSV